MILEPDAIPELDCMTASAGNRGWQRAALIAARLRMADVAQARGFSLNVSNFEWTSAEEAYGNRISALVGDKHFVVDTSRNGRGPAPGVSWCNPAGRGLGRPATTATGDPLADALLWIKAPGESDGLCNGGPPAGMWWAEYAL